MQDRIARMEEAMWAMQAEIDRLGAENQRLKLALNAVANDSAQAAPMRPPTPVIAGSHHQAPPATPAPTLDAPAPQAFMGPPQPPPMPAAVAISSPQAPKAKAPKKGKNKTVKAAASAPADPPALQAPPVADSGVRQSRSRSPRERSSSREERVAPRRRSPRCPSKEILTDEQTRDLLYPDAEDMDTTQWETVGSSRKGKRSRPKSPRANSPAKKALRTPAAPAPSAQAPPASSATPATDGGSSAPSSSSTPLGNPDKPDSCVLIDTHRYHTVMAVASQRGIRVVGSEILKSPLEGVRITVQGPEDYRALTRLFDEMSMAYHRRLTVEEKGYRAVLRGIHKDIPEDEVAADLKRKGIAVREVHRLYNRQKGKYDIVLIVTDPDQRKAVHSLKEVLKMPVRAETPNKRTHLSQCHNCQRYGHGARGCHAPPRCVKCAGDHATRDCERPKGCRDPNGIRCCNCLVRKLPHGHTANYGGCPCRPKSRDTGAKSKSSHPSGSKQKASRAAPQNTPQHYPALQAVGLGAPRNLPPSAAVGPHSAPSAPHSQAGPPAWGPAASQAGRPAIDPLYALMQVIQVLPPQVASGLSAHIFAATTQYLAVPSGSQVHGAY